MSDDKRKGSQDILWAPWRMEYIVNSEKVSGCIFCEKPKENNDQKNLIVDRGDYTFIIMNKYPYNNGHLMIVPYRHIADLSELTEKEKFELIDSLARTEKHLKKVMNPHGFNIGMNLGRIAGAGIDDHLHFHIVPRWGGDTNFMPILGNTKVVSEGLMQTWKKLRDVFDKNK